MFRRALIAAALVCVAAPATASAQITPGVMTTSESGQCTANFIFRDGSSTYVGSAAHCTSTGAATDTNGCEADSLPIGTEITIGGATQPGTLAYNSWLAMQGAGEDPASEACRFNDFALIRVHPDDVGRVSPTVPILGGPSGIAQPGALTQVESYQNSSLRLGIALLSPKYGLVLTRSPEGWSYTVYTLTPGIPGDSGSGFMTSGGQAFGVLSTLAVAPFPLSNGVGDLTRELDYARAHGAPGLALVNG